MTDQHLTSIQKNTDVLIGCSLKTELYKVDSHPVYTLCPCSFLVCTPSEVSYDKQNPIHPGPEQSPACSQQGASPTSMQVRCGFTCLPSEPSDEMSHTADTLTVAFVRPWSTGPWKALHTLHTYRHGERAICSCSS